MEVVVVEVVVVEVVVVVVVVVVSGQLNLLLNLVSQLLHLAIIFKIKFYNLSS